MRGLIVSICLALAAPASAGTVLFVGDSHSVGPFGSTLDGLLRAAGHNTATYASCGSIAQWWVSAKPTTCGYYFRGLDGAEEKGLKAPTPVFSDLLAAVKPDAVIVELGANYGGNPSDDFAVADMAAMVEKIKAAGAACYWVTKPDSRKSPEQTPRILALTAKAVGGYCRIFDSTKVTAYPAEGGDGIHYSSAAGRPIAEAWAKAVSAWLELPAKAAGVDRELLTR